MAASRNSGSVVSWVCSFSYSSAWICDRSACSLSCCSFSRSRCSSSRRRRKSCISWRDILDVVGCYLSSNGDGGCLFWVLRPRNPLAIKGSLATTNDVLSLRSGPTYLDLLAEIQLSKSLRPWVVCFVMTRPDIISNPDLVIYATSVIL
jgi:hypothetical protein